MALIRSVSRTSSRAVSCEAEEDAAAAVRVCAVALAWDCFNLIGGGVAIVKRNEPKPSCLENFKMSLFLSVREKEKESFECIYSVQGKESFGCNEERYLLFFCWLWNLLVGLSLTPTFMNGAIEVPKNKTNKYSTFPRYRYIPFFYLLCTMREWYACIQPHELLLVWNLKFNSFQLIRISFIFFEIEFQVY